MKKRFVNWLRRMIRELDTKLESLSDPANKNTIIMIAYGADGERCSTSFMSSNDVHGDFDRAHAVIAYKHSPDAVRFALRAILPPVTLCGVGINSHAMDTRERAAD